MDSNFVRYNIVIGSSFVLAYIVATLLIDVLHFKAWYTLLIINIGLHFARYPFMYK